jgi:16S rRNA (guanine966-N2)-methyltransferase
MPRIVSGKAGGIRLDSPKGMITRPTADKVKEAVFSSISNQIHGARFLDVFSGTGQIGIEALSRGARSVVFIDHSKECIRLIQQNLKKSHLEEHAEVISADVNAGILRIKDGDAFDLVYMDPPFDEAISSFRTVAALLQKQGVLAPDALVILEHRAEDVPDSFVMNLKLKRSCKYGTIMVSFYNVQSF